MNNTNVQLLEQVIELKLQECIDEGKNLSNESFEAAMKAIKISNEIDKTQNDAQVAIGNLTVQEDKVKHDKEINDENIKLQREKLCNEHDNKKIELEYMRIKTEMENDLKYNEIRINEEIRRLDIDVQRKKISVDEYLKEMEILNQGKHQNRDRGLKLFEVLAAMIVVPAIDYAVKNTFARTLCNFEKDYTFTTTAGKSLSSLFKFK